ncbi:MAG: FAD:protein FMN transferase [Ruminococcus sp.]|nr:FAD:protein FMN transferase [Ruminococcus sp.]
MKKVLLFIMAFSVLLFTGCSENYGENTSETTSQQSEELSDATRDFFAMDTYMNLTAYGKNADEAVDQAQKRVEELDKLLSTGEKNSEVSLLNKNRKAKLSEETFSLTEQSLYFYKLTDKAFDPAIYPIMKLWGFTDHNYKVPDTNSIKSTLKYIDASKISIDKKTSTVILDGEGMEVDFGGIAKGYTSSQIIEIFKSCGIKSGKVNLGGNVHLLGKKQDGSDWSIGIQNPNSTDDFLGILKASDTAVITSGGYERNFEENGTVYHHIIDPSTGYPANNGLTSVTIISQNGTLADALSTSLFVMGTEKAQDFWKNSKEDFEIILYTDDDKVIISKGIADKFTTSFDLTVIDKVN